MKAAFIGELGCVCRPNLDGGTELDLNFPAKRNKQTAQLNATDHLTREIVFGETRYDLARKRTDSPFAFLERISAI
jgi:hypothetical protein